MKQKKRLTNVTKMVIRDREGGIALPRYHFQRLICVTWSRCRRCCGQSPCHHLLNVSPVCWYLGQTIRFRRLPGILYLRLVQLYQLYAVCFYHSNIMVFFYSNNCWEWKIGWRSLIEWWRVERCRLDGAIHSTKNGRNFSRHRLNGGLEVDERKLVSIFLAFQFTFHCFP